MVDIHCHACGGFISDPGRISHLLADDASAIAVPRSGICTCRESVVYGPPTGYVSVPAMKSAALLN